MRGARGLGVVLLVALAGCVGDTPLDGSLGVGRFGTRARCEECPHLRRFALGGEHSIAVRLDPGCSPWTVATTGGAEITSDIPPEGHTTCEAYVRFRATVGGPASLLVRRLDGTTIDTFAFEVAPIGRLSLAPDLERHLWSPLDPDRIEVPLGAVFGLAVDGSAPGDGPAPGPHLLVDPAALTWTIEEGTAVALSPPPSGGSEPRAGVLYASSLGTARVRVSSGAVTDDVEIVVRPTEELAAEDSPFCFVTREYCDGLDNDCDGDADPPYALCPSGERCVAGACVAGP